MFVEQLEDRSLLAANITVNSVLDTDSRDSALTLREAILINNRLLAVASLSADEQAQVNGTPSSADTDTIAFNIAGSGVHTISAASDDLPRITDPVVVDGYTQPGAKPNSDPVGFNGTLLVELHVVNGNAYGLELATSDSLIRGLIVNGARLAGIQISGFGPGSRNIIQGNFLGTNATGTAAIPNGSGVGIDATSGNMPRSENNLIGGATPAARNLISGNDTGVLLVGLNYSVRNTVVQGNFIGTDVTGKSALGNHIGVNVFNSAEATLIGGSKPGEGNLVSGNLYEGIRIGGIQEICTFTGVGGDSIGNVVHGNKIGTDVTGLQPLGNGANGITFGVTTGPPQIIGGTGPGEANIIAFNTLHGVGVPGGHEPIIGSHVAILSNSIFSNGKLGIHLGYDCFATPNDPGDADAGPNNLQNFPVISSATLTASRLTINYAVPSATTNSAYPLRVEFFIADSDGQEGRVFIGSDTYVAAEAGAMKTASFTSAAEVAVGDKIVSTATDSANNTSEFSANITLQAGACSSVVINTADTGAGSLREAINCANSTPGTDTISFNFPQHDSGRVYYFNDDVAGQVSRANVKPTTAVSEVSLFNPDPDWPHSWWSIQASDFLPQIQDAVTIDGFTQPGAKSNTNAGGQPGNAILRVEIDGSGMSNGSGPTVYDADTTIRGLVINRFAGDGISIVTGNNIFIHGNYIGTDVSGTLALPNEVGIMIWPGAGFASIGSSAPADGNLISGNRAEGLALGANQGACGGANHIEGASIGNVIRGNKIGTDVSGTRPLGNGGIGIMIGNSESGTLTVGGANPGEGNIITYSGVNGISLLGSHTAILGNSIFSNANLGIGFAVNCTATPNDPNDPDGGPNKLQNFPELAAATRGAGMLRVAYKVPSLPANSTYPLRVEFFKADSDGQEGQSFLGFDTFTAADFAAGLKTVTIATVALIAKGDKLVATATDSLPAGGGPANTSEFSLGLLIGTNPWHNAVKPLDVNGGTNNAPDDHIAAGDALAIINYINSFGPTDVPEDAAIGLPFGFLDPTNDNNVAPADALEVINHINAFGNSEGESSISDSLVPQVGRRSPDPDLLTLLALDTATGTPRRRR